MRTLFLLSFCLCLAMWATPAEAQAKYFTGGERVGAAGGFLSKGDDVKGFGVQAEAMITPRFGLAFGLGWSELEEIYDVNDISRTDVSSWSFGGTFYAGRQNVDGPITVGIGIGVGGVTADPSDDSAVSATTLSTGVEVAHAITAADGLFVTVPTANVALSLALGESNISTVTSVGAGLGIGLRASPSFIVTVEPGLTVTFDRTDTTLGFLGLLSLNVAY